MKAVYKIMLINFLFSIISISVMTNPAYSFNLNKFIKDIDKNIKKSTEKNEVTVGANDYHINKIKKAIEALNAGKINIMTPFGDLQKGESTLKSLTQQGVNVGDLAQKLTEAEIEFGFKLHKQQICPFFSIKYFLICFLIPPSPLYFSWK